MNTYKFALKNLTKNKILIMMLHITMVYGAEKKVCQYYLFFERNDQIIYKII